MRLIVRVFSVGVLGLFLASGTHAEENRFIRTEANASLDEVNDTFTVLAQRYRSFEPAERPQLLSELKKQAKLRAAAMALVLDTDPQRLLELSLPGSVYDSLPPDLQNEVERPVTASGTLDSVRSEKSTEFPFRLRDNRGRAFKLYCVGKPPAAMSGATATIRGVQFKDNLVFRSEDCVLESRSRFDREAPRVTITKPVRGNMARKTVTVRVEATDNGAIQDIHLLRDGGLLDHANKSPAVFTWDTTNEGDGPHTLTARASDMDFNIGQSEPVTVTVDNTAPELKLVSPSGRQSVSGKVVLQAQARDALGLDTVKFLVDGRAVGVLTTEPFSFSWDSATGPNGPHAVQAVATDKAGNETASDTVEMRVLNANSAPVLAPIGGRKIQEGVSLFIPLSAHDPDGPRDHLSFSVENLPDWASLDPQDNAIRGTPGFDVANETQPERIYPGVVVRVCDSQPLCDKEDINITVQDMNRSPIIQPLADTLISEGEELNLTPVFMDADKGDLTCTIENAPLWARIDPKTCTLHGTPGFNVASRGHKTVRYADIRFTACDTKKQCASTSMSVVVKDVNHPPAIDFVSDQKVEEQRFLSFAVHAADPDGDVLTLEADQLPRGAAFAPESDGWGFFEWTPGKDQAGTYTVKFQASDGDITRALPVIIAVGDNAVCIGGKVLTELRRPFVDVTVELSRAGQHSQEAETGKDGRFLFMDLTPGTYTLRCRYPLSKGTVSTTGVGFSPVSLRVELKDKDRLDCDFRSQLNK